jgi:hypothetical protein
MIVVSNRPVQKRHKGCLISMWLFDGSSSPALLIPTTSDRHAPVPFNAVRQARLCSMNACCSCAEYSQMLLTIGEVTSERRYDGADQHCRSARRTADSGESG